MPNSKLTEQERKELFASLAVCFEARDTEYAYEMREYIQAIINSTDLEEHELIEVVQYTLEFGAELSALLKPYQHSIDWMNYAARLVAVMLNSAKRIRQIAVDAGVDINDAESIIDLKKSAESVAPLRPTIMPNPSKAKH
jgi:hypothetical protein